MGGVPENGHKFFEAGMAAMSDDPERLVSGAQIGIADVADGEPAGQFGAQSTAVQLCLRGTKTRPLFQMILRDFLWLQTSVGLKC